MSAGASIRCSLPLIFRLNMLILPLLESSGPATPTSMVAPGTRWCPQNRPDTTESMTHRCKNNLPFILVPVSTAIATWQGAAPRI